MDFAAISALQPSPDIPANLNGWSQRISMSDRIERVDDIAKVVEAAGTGINLNATFAHILHCVQGKPNVNTPVTAEHMATAAPRLANAISVQLMLAAMHSAEVPIDAVLRGSDVITIADWDAKAAVHVHCTQFAGRIWAWLNETPDRMQDFCKDSRWVFLALYANAMHRHMENGHNWYTDRASVRNTSAFRCVHIAGADQELFAAFMAKYGHDIWHFLSDQTLIRFCNALSGKPDPVMFSANAFVYDGADRARSAFHLVFKTPDSAKDRWPLGQVGGSGLVLGLDLLKALIVAIVAKIGVEGASSVVNAIDQMRSVFTAGGADAVTRPHLTAAKGRLSEIIAFAIGFSCATSMGRDFYEDKGSLSFFKSAHEDRFSAGRAFADQIAEIKVSKASLTAAVEVAFNDIRNALSSVNNAMGGVGPVRDALNAIGELVVSVPMSSTETSTNIELRKLAIEEAKAGLN